MRTKRAGLLWIYLPLEAGVNTAFQALPGSSFPSCCVSRARLCNPPSLGICLVSLGSHWWTLNHSASKPTAILPSMLTAALGDPPCLSPCPDPSIQAWISLPIAQLAPLSSLVLSGPYIGLEYVPVPTLQLLWGTRRAGGKARLNFNECSMTAHLGNGQGQGPARICVFITIISSLAPSYDRRRRGSECSLSHQNSKVEFPWFVVLNISWVSNANDELPAACWEQ